MDNGMGMMPGSPTGHAEVAVEEMDTPPKGLATMMQFEHVHKSFATSSVLTDAQVEKVNEILDTMVMSG